MAESQDADNDALTFETPDESETVTVPETFTRDDLSAYFGSIPRSWDTEVVFIYDEMLRAGAFVDGEWVEAVYCDERHRCFNASGRGWIVETTEYDGGSTDASDAPGETLWTAE